MRYRDRVVPRVICGAALVELAISIMLMILILGGFWMLLTAEDLRHTVISSVYSGLNRPQNRVFQTDITGSLLRYDSDSVVPLMADIKAEVGARFGDSSPLSAGLSELDCSFQLNYLTLNSGIPTVDHVMIPGDPGTNATPSEQAAFLLAQSEANTFAIRLGSKRIQPPNSSVQFFSDYHFLPAPDPIPEPVEYYMDSFAFFSWGCVTQRNLFVMNLDSSLSGVFVPNRML